MEDSDREEEEDTETELSRDVIYEHQDENTLIQNYMKHEFHTQNICDRERQLFV